MIQPIKGLDPARRAGTRLIAQSLPPLRQKAAPPFAHGLRMNAELLLDLPVLQAIGATKNDPRPPRQGLRPLGRDAKLLSSDASASVRVNVSNLRPANNNPLASMQSSFASHTESSEMQFTTR